MIIWRNKGVGRDLKSFLLGWAITVAGRFCGPSAPNEVWNFGAFPKRYWIFDIIIIMPLLSSYLTMSSHLCVVQNEPIKVH